MGSRSFAPEYLAKLWRLNILFCAYNLSLNCQYQCKLNLNSPQKAQNMLFLLDLGLDYMYHINCISVIILIWKAHGANRFLCQKPDPQTETIRGITRCRLQRRNHKRNSQALRIHPSIIEYLDQSTVEQHTPARSRSKKRPERSAYLIRNCKSDRPITPRKKV
jgi:hypothetical protein